MITLHNGMRIAFVDGYSYSKNNYVNFSRSRTTWRVILQYNQPLFYVTHSVAFDYLFPASKMLYESQIINTGMYNKTKTCLLIFFLVCLKYTYFYLYILLCTLFVCSHFFINCKIDCNWCWCIFTIIYA